MKKPPGRNLNEVIAERRARKQMRVRDVVLVIAAVWLITPLAGRWLEARRNPDPSQIRSVVLPLDNRTGDPALDPVGLVASDWITRVLGMYAPGYEVVPTTTTLAYQQSAQLARFDLVSRAERLGRGTRAPIVIWGSYYRVGDSLRFNVEITDLKARLMVGSIPQISAPVDSPMVAIDRLRSAVVGALLKVESAEYPRRRPYPSYPAYRAFVNGQRALAGRHYAMAASYFGMAALADTAVLASHVWQADAFLRARMFDSADVALRRGPRRFVIRSDGLRAMRVFARLRIDNVNVYRASAELASINSADDLAAYDYAMSLLALNQPRAARRLFSEMAPTFGALHGRPEYYLHFAATYHMLGNHRAEQRVVRNAMTNRNRTAAARLANCRVRAALGVEENARVALDVLTAADTDTLGTIRLSDAVDDCAAELDAHGFPALAARARAFSRTWHSRRPRPPQLVWDTAYEKGYLKLDEARTHAHAGRLAEALTDLADAHFAGLPYYEPGRVMLHADPAFRRLRNTRGFLRINQPRG